MTILWIVLWAVLLIAEVLTLALFSLFFSFGALSAALASWCGLNFYWQLAIFSITSIGSLFVLRGTAKKLMSKNKGKQDEPHFLQGQQGVVTKLINSSVVGEVSVGGSYWKAISSENIDVDTLVKVIGSDSELILKVEKVIN